MKWYVDKCESSGRCEDNRCNRSVDYGRRSSERSKSEDNGDTTSVPMMLCSGAEWMKFELGLACARVEL